MYESYFALRICFLSHLVYAVHTYVHAYCIYVQCPNVFVHTVAP
jgi:hypothetical protein